MNVADIYKTIDLKAYKQRFDKEEHKKVIQLLEDYEMNNFQTTSRNDLDKYIADGDLNTIKSKVLENLEKGEEEDYLKMIENPDCNIKSQELKKEIK